MEHFCLSHIRTHEAASFPLIPSRLFSTSGDQPASITGRVKETRKYATTYCIPSIVGMVKDSGSSWIYLGATALASFFLVGMLDSFGIFLAIFIDYYNETNTKAAWVGSLLYFLELVLSPLVVYLHHSIGFHWCMAIASAFYTSAILTTPFVPNLNFVFLTMSIPLGITLSFIGILSITTQREYFSKYYGLAIGVRFGFTSAGATVFSFFMPLLFDSLGWKKGFWSMLAIIPVFVYYAFAYRLPHDSSRQAKNELSKVETSISATKDVYYELLQDKILVICLISSTIFFFALLIPGTFMVRYGVRLGYPLSDAKWLLTIKNICALPARFIAGHIGDIALRRGKVKVLTQITIFLFGLSSALCSLTQSLPLLMVYMGCIGVLEGFFYVIFPLLIAEITAGYHINDAIGFFYFCAAFSFLLGTPTAGWIYDATEDFRHVFYVVFVTSFIAALLLLLSSCMGMNKSYALVQKSSRENEPMAERTKVVAIKSSEQSGKIVLCETVV